MIIRRLVLTVVAVGLGGSIAIADSSKNPKLFRHLATEAMTADRETADRAIAKLRDHGPSSLRGLLVAHDRLALSRSGGMKANTAATVKGLERNERTLRKLETVIDRVAGQRYAHISRLYWYTDLDQARKAAAESGKPILSLRLLGNLTDEFSCANSRFFRTTLYANREIADRLGSQFVLHWKSVRPVPRVTIDFGDGRKLERTLTGNSAHYALAPDGTPLDVLPGLYGPRQFLAWLDNVERLHHDLQAVEPAERDGRLRTYHADASRELVRNWRDDLAAVTEGNRSVDEFDNDPARLAALMNESRWYKIATLEKHRVELDGNARGIVRRENTAAVRAGAISMPKALVEDPILRLVRTLQETIGVDSVRNEYTLHRKAHEWFAGERTPADVERLNERVYAVLFLTPASDPWLGLAPADTYTALSGGSVVTASP